MSESRFYTIPHETVLTPDMVRRENLRPDCGSFPRETSVVSLRVQRTTLPKRSEKTVTVVCAWCQPNPAPVDFITHGICASCANKLLEEAGL